MADNTLFTIDGKEVEAKPGQTILQAALDAGIYIPYLCYFPHMKPYGSCRTCVVEAEANGRRMTVASCTSTPMPDMVVETQNESVSELRKGIIEMLMSEHPHGCLTCHRIELCGPQDMCQRHVAVTDRCTICPKNERCELKDTVRSVELDLRTPLKYYRRGLPIHADDPLYDRDYNLCIVCARCVRVCSEIRGDAAITMDSRSGTVLVGTSHGTSLMESGCEFCGACIDVCPTGALVEREYKWEKAVRQVSTVCTNCPVGCEMIAEINRFDKVIRFRGDFNSEINKGQACFKGKFKYDYPNHRARLKKPYIRRDGVVANASWNEAFIAAAQALSGYEPHEVAVIASPRGSNEDNFVAQQFARTALDTNQVDSAHNFRHDLTQYISQRWGEKDASRTIWEIENAKSILVISGNPTEEQNVLAIPVKKAAREGAKLVVIDQRETELTRYADIWIRPRIGTEHLLVMGIVRAIVDCSFEQDDFIREKTDNLTEFRQSLWDFDLGRVARLCQVSIGEITEAAVALAREPEMSVLLGVDTIDSQYWTRLADAVMNLRIINGSVDRGSSGLYPLYLGPNTNGSQLVGCAPLKADSPLMQQLAEACPDGIASNPAMGVAEIFEAMRNRTIKAAVIMADGLDPAIEELGDVLHATNSLEKLVVSSLFDNELTATADVVLPATAYTEQTSTIVNLESRVQLIRKAWEPKHQQKAGWEIFTGIAKAMGEDGFEYESSSQVFQTISSLIPEFQGMSHESLDEASAKIAMPDAENQGKYSFEIVEPDFKPPADQNGSIYFMPGRVLHQPNRDITLVERNHLNAIGGVEDVAMHIKDAQELGIAEGAPVVLKDASGKTVAEGVASLSLETRGMVSVTTLFGELATYLEESEYPDPSSRVPRLNIKAVSVEQAPSPAPMQPVAV